MLAFVFCSLISLTLVAGPIAAAEPADRPFWRPVVMGKFGMVAAEHPLEAAAAMKALERGGNAIDAAVAAFYMTGVVEQHQAGMGGDGFLLAYIAEQDRVVFFNGTGPAPKLATRDFYLDHGGIPDSGPLSTDVPGAVGGFDLAHRTYGTLDYQTLLEPAIEVAESGHPLSFWSASQHARNLAKIQPYPSSLELLTDNGRAPSPGWLFVQKDLAASLRLLAERGVEAFYRGPLARKFAAFYESQGGLLRYDDLAEYEAEQADPIRTEFRGFDVYQSAPNSQGIVMLIALNILEGYDLRALDHNSPEYLHLVVEALKLAFADRNEYVGDPRFTTNMPTAELLAKDYAAARRKLIRKDRAMERAAPPGDPRSTAAVRGGLEVRYADAPAAIERPAESHDAGGETSSFSIADQFGNLVSVTHSVNAGFGSGMIVPGAGIVLNDRMPYFSLEEDDVNVLAPGKRPRHTVNPALALKGGKPFLAWNTPGGDNQAQAMLQAFLNVVVFGMNVQQAVEAATVTSSAFGASMYPQPINGKLTMPRALGEEVADALAEKGHRVDVVDMQQPYSQAPTGAGAVKMVMIDENRIMHGGVSPAKDDYVLGR